MTDNEQLTTDEKLLRLADMIDWLLFHNVVASRRELAKRMKYQESTLSLVVNGKQPISPKFLTALAGVDDRLNVDWINSGEGDMILEVEEDTVVPSQEEIALLMRQQEAVKWRSSSSPTLSSSGTSRLYSRSKLSCRKSPTRSTLWPWRSS